MYRQHPPYCIQIELTEGCNLRCPFCGLNGIRDLKDMRHKFMSPVVMGRMTAGIKRLGWNSRLELAMHGEPSLHPQASAMIHIIRMTLPNQSIMMTSNGGGLLPIPGPTSRIRDLFASGLNVLALDDYDNVHIVEKIRPHLSEVGIKTYEYPKEPDGNPHRRFPAKTQFISIIESIDLAKEGVHATLNNHCGAGAALNDKAAGKKCAKPFRELSVRWDGSVALCCNDWRGVYKCGNLLHDSLEDIWWGAGFEAARKYLIRGRREFPPCFGCDALSYRTGLLPDGSGKVKLEEPDENDLKAIDAAIGGPPYTEPVLRPWEKV